MLKVEAAVAYIKERIENEDPLNAVPDTLLMRELTMKGIYVTPQALRACRESLGFANGYTRKREARTQQLLAAGCAG